MKIIEGRKKPLKGVIEVPGDKSISHRAIMIGSIADGETYVENFLTGEDCISTVKCFKKLGVNIYIEGKNVYIKGNGIYGLKKPTDSLYVGNSGTTIRLISGILVGQKFSSFIYGDISISKRPMDRIIIPLKMMGGNIKGRIDRHPPLCIEPTEELRSIDYIQDISSAQVKSCILLAGLYADGETRIVQPSKSRDHTERMLRYFGADIKTEGNNIKVNGHHRLMGDKKVFVPGDISSAAYFIVGGLIIKDSKIVIKNVGLNYTRTGIIEILKKMGGNINIKDMKIVNNEPMGDVYVEYSKLRGVQIRGDIIPRLIDEIPIIAVAASVAYGDTIIRDAQELKLKETNRISAVVEQLKMMGVDIRELEDGMIIRGNHRLNSAELKSYGDHRIAMALNVAALCADGASILNEDECINISFPNFYEILGDL